MSHQGRSFALLTADLIRGRTSALLVQLRPRSAANSASGVQECPCLLPATEALSRLKWAWPGGWTAPGRCDVNPLLLGLRACSSPKDFCTDFRVCREAASTQQWPGVQSCRTMQDGSWPFLLLKGFLCLLQPPTFLNNFLLLSQVVCAVLGCRLTCKVSVKHRSLLIVKAGEFESAFNSALGLRELRIEKGNRLCG